MKEVPKLTAKQRAFCEEYLIDLNATQAAIRAGYSEKTAYSIGNENLSKPELADYIALLMANRSKKVEINAEWVLKKAVALHERCMEAEAVTDRDGNEIGTFKFHAQGAAKSLELIGKHIDVKAFEESQDSKELPIAKIEIEVVGADSKD